jgi:hypothetical protein
MRALLPFGLVALSCPGLAHADAPEPSRPAVAVYRGSEANVPSPIPVLRGSSAMGVPPVPAVQQAPAVVAAGSKLWVLDPNTGALTGCRLLYTYEVGVDAIRCTTTGKP